MKVIAAIDADLETTPLGTASRLADALAGRPVLRRTVERVVRAGSLDEVYVVCPPEQAAACADLVDGLNANVVPHPGVGPPFRALTRAARKWSLEGWRGGLGGATTLDEYADCAALASLAKQARADALWTCGGAAAVVDPALIDAMVDHYLRIGHTMRFTFATVPPGLAGLIMETALLDDLGKQNIPPGWLLAYKPDAPQMDLAFKDCCFPASAAMRHASGRVMVDTRRAYDAVAGLLAVHPDPDGETVGRWLIERAGANVPPLPREVEIELTTEDQLGQTPHRPRGERVPARGPIDPQRIAEVADALAAYDDSLVVLGGFGEPMLHPQFGEICRLLSESGVYGVAVRTNAIGLDEAAIETLLGCRLDVINVLLDAWTEELYQRLHPGRTLAEVLQNLDRLSKAREAARQVEPLIVPQMTKSVETAGELDAFFDGWIRGVGCAAVEGYSHYAGQLPDRSLVDMSPPTRTPCRRIHSRCLILADGRMTRCDQDFTGQTAVGSLAETTLADLWQGHTLTTARTCHAEGRYDDLPLCGTCAEWHRP
ncbi:MAG: radical SAM protein [bacterium]|nr:radical SAM protein [bacterium]